MPTITEEKETLQITGLEPQQKMDIKVQALRRNMTVARMMLVAYNEYIRKHPLSS